MYTTREQDLVYQNEVKEIKLLSLLEITNAINENAPVDHLMKIFTFILKEQLGFSKFVLLMHQKEWENPVKIGYKGKINLNTIDKEFNRFKEITIIESSKSKLLHQFQVIIPVFHSEKPLAFLLLASNLDSENETSYFSPKSQRSTFFRSGESAWVAATAGSPARNSATKAAISLPCPNNLPSASTTRIFIR